MGPMLEKSPGPNGCELEPITLASDVENNVVIYSERARAAGIVSTSNPGQQWPGFFYAWKMKRKKKEQATSNMRQGSG